MQIIFCKQVQKGEGSDTFLGAHTFLKPATCFVHFTRELRVGMPDNVPVLTPNGLKVS